MEQTIDVATISPDYLPGIKKQSYTSQIQAVISIDKKNVQQPKSLSNWSTCHKYPNIFKNGDVFPCFQMCMRSRVAYSNRFRPSIRKRFTMEMSWDSIPHRACVMLVVNDVLYGISYSTSSVFVRPHVDGQRFEKSSLWRAFLKRCNYGDCFYRVRVLGKPNRKKISVFNQKRIHVDGA